MMANFPLLALSSCSLQIFCDSESPVLIILLAALLDELISPRVFRPIVSGGFLFYFAAFFNQMFGLLRQVLLPLAPRALT